MFLMQLENQEKFEFLRLAHYIAHIDGDFRIDEAEMIRDYCCEMGVSDVAFDAVGFDLEQTLEKFSSQKSQKILLLELLTLVHADDRFDLYEHKLIDKITCYFKIDANLVNLYSQWGKALSALKTQGQGFIEM